MAASLAETSDPEKLIPGHPDAVRTTASRFTVFGDALVAAGEGLKRIDTEDGWKGNAADKFREAFDGEPKRWITSGDAFHDAAAALTSYAGTLEWAQGQAAEAATLWKEGQEATQQARSAHDSAVQQALVSGSVPPQFHDLGEEKRDAAQGKLNRARQQLNEAGDRAEKTVGRARDKAPKEPNFLQKVGGFLGDVGEALWEGGKDAIDTLVSVGNAVAHHPEDLLTVAAGAGLMALGGAGMTGGTGISLASGGTLAAGGVPLAVVSAGVAATGATMAGIGTANIMQHAANDDRVTPTHGEGGGGKSGAEIKSELDDLAQGRQEHVRTVRTDEDLQTLYDQWSRGGTSIDKSTYNGSMVELPDGTTVGLREASKSGDRTIDVALPDGTGLKVHISGS